MFVITKNTNAQWRLGSWCRRHRIDAQPRTLEGALADDELREWSLIADPGLPALIRGARAFADKHADAPRLRLVFVGASRPFYDEFELKSFEQLSDLVWITHVAWPSRSGELRAILRQPAPWAAATFSACAAHELVTPLATLRGWCDLLTRTEPEHVGDRATTALPVMRRSISQLERVVADLRSAECLAAGTFSLDLSEVDVNAVATTAADSVLPLATDKGISLRAIISPHAPRVQGDATRLLQVLHNLLANSLRFTPTGGRIEIRVTQQDSSVLIAVRDTGKGLSAAQLSGLFTRPLSDGGAPRYSGLGLTIAREIVERHRGEIRAHSSGEDQGTLVVVSLPASTLEP